MPDPTLPHDPLRDVVYLSIPEELSATLSPFINPHIPIPLERPAGAPSVDAISVPAIRLSLRGPGGSHRLLGSQLTFVGAESAVGVADLAQDLRGRAG